MKEKDNTPPPGRSRRRHPRVDSLGHAFANIGAGEEGSVLNLSLGGLLLRLKRALTPGSSYILKLYLGNEVAVVEARVVRLLTGTEECLAGLEFLQVSPRDRGALLKFLGPAGA